MSERMRGAENQENQIIHFSGPPSEYLAKFEQSREYQDAFLGYVRSLRNETSRASDDDIKLSFPETDTYKNSLWDFFRNNKLEYNPSLYQQEKFNRFDEKLTNYWQLVREIEKRNKETGATRAMIQDNEVERVSYHAKVAKELVKIKEVPNQRVGKLIIQFLSESANVYKADPQRDEWRRHADFWGQN